MADQNNHSEDIIYLIKCLDKELAKDFDRRLAEFGLTGQQGRLLFFIYCQTHHEGNIVHQNDVEKTFLLSKSTVSGLVDRLVKKELIERVIESPYVSLVVTQKGTDIVESIRKNKNQTIKKLTQNLSDEEVQRMIQNIKLLINNIKEEEEDAK